MLREQLVSERERLRTERSEVATMRRGAEAAQKRQEEEAQRRRSELERIQVPAPWLQWRRRERALSGAQTEAGIIHAEMERENQQLRQQLVQEQVCQPARAACRLTEAAWAQSAVAAFKMRFAARQQQLETAEATLRHVRRSKRSASLAKADLTGTRSQAQMELEGQKADLERRMVGLAAPAGPRARGLR